MDLLRSCAGCSAHLLTNDGLTQKVYCRRCRPKHVKPHEEWVAGLAAGSEVFVQPCAAWRGLSHSRNVVVSRSGDEVTIQIVGMPESRQTLGIHLLGQDDLTPRSRTGALS